MTPSTPRPIAIYDLDRTITSVPTWTFFLLFAARRTAPWRLALLPLLPILAGGKKIGLYHRGRLKELMHRTMLGSRMPAARLATVTEAFADLMVPRFIRPGAIMQIAADRAEGRRIVIATASHAFVATPIARRLGVDDLVSTRASYDASGNLRHRLVGENCFGGAKHEAVQFWLASLDHADAPIRFYSDDVSDAPMLERAEEPIAVNPGPALRLLATARGWPIVEWGKRRR